MKTCRREFLRGGLTTIAVSALGKPVLAQSFPFTPNQRYPDPSVEILDPSFAKYRIYSSTVEQLATGMRWAEGPVYFPEGRYVLLSDIPNNRIMKYDEARTRSPCFATTPTTQTAIRVTGRAASLPANIRDTPGDANRGERRDHRSGRQYEGKRLNAPNDVIVKSDDTIWFSRSPVRDQWRMGRLAGQAGAGDDERLPHQPGR